jgi:hypothetical protein
MFVLGNLVYCLVLGFPIKQNVEVRIYREQLVKVPLKPKVGNKTTTQNTKIYPSSNLKLEIKNEKLIDDLLK